MKLLRNMIVTLAILSSSLSAGEYGDAFLLASAHPQVYAMGNSTVATIVLGGHALNNPAGFVNGAPAYISLIYDQFEDLSQSIGFEAKMDLTEKYDLGLTLINNSIGDLYARPNLSTLTPQSRRDSVLVLAAEDAAIINYRESAVLLSMSREFRFYIDLGWVYFKIPCRVPVGISVKYIDKLLDENRGLGSGIDAGTQFFFNLGGMNDWLIDTEFSVGLFISDILNTPIFWTTEHQDAIKRQATFGYAVTQSFRKYDTVLSLSKSNQDRYGTKSQYGVEVKIKDAIFIRVGHDGTTTSFGLGIGLKKFIIDYSFSQHELSDMQKIGINYQFQR